MKKQTNRLIVGTDDNGIFTLTVRKFFTVLLLIFFSIHYGNAQTTVIKQADGTYTTAHKQRAKTEAISTGEFFRTQDGQKLPIMQSKNGKLFVVRTSKKTGANYNFYISKN